MLNAADMQSKILSAATSEQYELYRAALEWDLAEPIVIESRNDVKSESRWKERVEPFHHQVSNLITFCRRLPVTLLADDVGLGKTISAGLIISELVARSRLSKVLIVAPKLLGPQWKEELRSKFDIQAEVVIGRDLLRAEPDGVGAIITTYHSARDYLDRMPKDRFEMLILDEAHKLRNLYGVPSPPQVAIRFRKALEERRFRFVLMLTATPIQNRLWDLYSLVDLLTVARGHTNPFGGEGQFARKFIADDREKARQLKPEAANEFRSIVYGYMSRVRRGDANLHFPDREVRLHRVDPTLDELQLIKVVGKGIEKLNRLAQIGILQALTSSPHALTAQLDNMERNRTIAPEFAGEVRAIVRQMTTSAKLNSLGMLIEQLKRENPDRWRLVVFTGRRETQTTIQTFLEQHGLSVGVINGSSGSRNQETIASFRANPPKLRVIVSTEAGSEGVNLQVANVLVNYDLPWNPMIVEQRIGRIQRLASEHASVAIFNITLQGTFEEYIVGRLMEKLQMSTSAIGDIEALLEGAGIDGDDESGGFEEKIRQLVVAALRGADVEAAVERARRSIEEAKATLQREEKQIDEMMGQSVGAGYVGPRMPTLPSVERSMDPKSFVLAALSREAARTSALSETNYLVETSSGRNFIRFDGSPEGERGDFFRPGSALFAQLVQRSIASGMHIVHDLNENTENIAVSAGGKWAQTFGAIPLQVECEGARRWFSGNVLLRVRATVAHDSYERLVSVPVPLPRGSSKPFSRQAMGALPGILRDPAADLDLSFDVVQEAIERDPSIAEFSRFYLERRAQEIAAAGGDERKRKKMEDDFTPRYSVALVGADGGVLRDVRVRISYNLDGGTYTDEIALLPSTGRILSSPPLEECAATRKVVPQTCLSACAVTGQRVLTHRLVKSDVTGRLALAERTLICEATGKRVLEDEAGRSDVTGRRVAKAFLKTSSLSGRSAEYDHFERCSFTGVELFIEELRGSEISGKPYRVDQMATSAVSGRSGHRSEFVACNETKQLLLPAEAERCDVTGQLVRPGILLTCQETGARVLPSELGTSSVSNKRARRILLIQSSVSGAYLLEREAIRSSSGAFCRPDEALLCDWGGKAWHPDDIKTCSLTGLAIHVSFLSPGPVPRLEPLRRLLDGIAHDRDHPELWGTSAASASALLGNGKVQIVAAQRAAGLPQLAAVAEVRSFLGMKVRYAGLVADTRTGRVKGRICIGRRNKSAWIADN